MPLLWLLCACLIALLTKPIRAQETLIPNGWTEAIASVSDLRRATDFFRTVGGWQVQHRGSVDPAVLSAWGLPREITAREVLLGLGKDSRGYLRLVQFNGAAAQQIRSSAQAWDSGGFFDLTVMVASMEETFNAMQLAGWHGYSEPIEGSAGPLRFSKVRMRGFDGIVMALIERISPALEGWPEFQRMSHPFSVSLVTADYPGTRRFYEQLLGFDVYLEGHGRPQQEGPTLSGFPLSLSDEIGGHYVIMRPEPAALPAGRVEILAYDVTGRDLAARARPPNYGLFALRYRVPDAMALATTLEQRGAELVYAPRTLHLPPAGQVTQFAIQTPHGGWIEFFQRPER